MNILITGPQASGKGTQSDLISKKYGIKHISPGVIFRKNIEKGTKLGKLADSYINKGKLVPDDVTNKLVEQEIRSSKKGFILDGYPRNVEQAKFLDAVTDVDYLVYIKLSREETIRRISARRVCEDCGKNYGYLDKEKIKGGKCPSCGGRLIQREDDAPAAIEKRLDIYHSETEPVIEHYRKKGIVKEINGEQPIEKVFEDIVLALE